LLITRKTLSCPSILSETHYSLKEMETVLKNIGTIPSSVSSETHYSLKEMETLHQHPPQFLN